MAIGEWFATDFDDPVPARPLPAVFNQGREPEIRVVDQVVRGVNVVGRVIGAHGAVALKVDTVDRPIRVAVTVTIDGTAHRNWSRATSPARGARERPRVMLLRAQGVDRCGMVLARQRGPVRMSEAHATLTFDLTAREAGDGLVVIELADLGAALPGWAAAEVSSLASVGVCIRKVEVLAQEDAPATTQAGRLTGQAAQAAGVAFSGGLLGRCGRQEGHPRTKFVVVNPGSATGLRCRIQATTTPAAAAAERHFTCALLRWRPARAALKLFRIGARALGGAVCRLAFFVRQPRADRLTVRAVDLASGADRDVAVVTRGRDLLDVSVSGNSGPVLLGLDHRGWRPRRYRLRELACRVVEVEV